VVSGEPLFAPVVKFDSGTGWPSFTKPLEPANVVENVDRSYGLDFVHYAMYSVGAEAWCTRERSYPASHAFGIGTRREFKRRVPIPAITLHNNSRPLVCAKLLTSFLYKVETE
jgi:hypothetical protein